jgi:hypothetical protein
MKDKSHLSESGKLDQKEGPPGNNVRAPLAHTVDDCLDEAAAILRRILRPTGDRMKATRAAVVQRAMETIRAKRKPASKPRLSGIGGMMSVTTSGSESTIYHYDD